MKKLILAAFALTTAASVFAQGTVLFNNRSTLGTSHIYGPSTINPGLSLIGQGAGDSPVGATAYAASGMALIGAGGSGGHYGYTTTLAQLLAYNGTTANEALLTPGGTTSTFRSGSGAGFINGIQDTLEQLANDGKTAATVEIVAWDNSSGLYSSWTLASVAWNAGLIAAGKGGLINMAVTGGGTQVPVNFPTTSFNLYFIPEPSTFALAGLGAAAMLIFRRRK